MLAHSLMSLSTAATALQELMNPNSLYLGSTRVNTVKDRSCSQSVLLKSCTILHARVRICSGSGVKLRDFLTTRLRK